MIPVSKAQVGRLLEARKKGFAQVGRTEFHLGLASVQSGYFCSRRLEKMVEMFQGARAKFGEPFGTMLRQRYTKRFLKLSNERSLTVVTEAHYVRGSGGGWESSDGVNGDTQWERYLPVQRRLFVAGRARIDASFTGQGDPVTVAELLPITDAQGAVQLVRKFPAIVFDLAGVVFRSDLIVLRMPGPITLLAGFLAMGLGRQYAVEIVGDFGALFNGRSRHQRVLGSFFDWGTRLVVRNAVAVRYVTALALQAQYPSSAEIQASISNVQLPDALLVSSRRERVANALAPNLLAVGTHQADYKGHQFAIRALPSILEKSPGAKLVLIGEGEYQPELKKLAMSVGVADRVIFTGRLPRERVLEWMDSSDILLQPSITEGLPRTVIEASARGLPCVGSDVAGIPELVDHRLLVPVGDVERIATAVRLLIDEETLYAQISERAIETAGRFTNSVQAPKFESWFNSLSSL